MDNRAADALSRCPQPATGELAAISVCLPTWLQEVQFGYRADPRAQKLLTQLVAEPEKAPKKFTLEDGIIKLNGRIWVGSNGPLQQKIITALHASAIGGHSGFGVTYRRLRTLFAWPGLKDEVRQFVDACAICKQAKPERYRYPGLLEPLPVPPHLWHTVTMDFVEGLPRSAGFNCILVVVDKLSRYAHFMPLSHPFTAYQVAQTYVSNIYKIHGLPAAIVSDRDKVFTSNLWKELFRLTQTRLQMSSAYHPQTDGQTERINQCLETYLCCFAHACPTKWQAWLHWQSFGTTPRLMQHWEKHRLKCSMATVLDTSELLIRLIAPFQSWPNGCRTGKTLWLFFNSTSCVRAKK